MNTTPRLNEIAAYMSKRHQVYLDRKAGKPGPWTDDLIISNGRFCNVFRELDTVTIWVDQNIRKPYHNHPLLWLMLAIARYINWPPTLLHMIQSNSWPDRETWRPSDLTGALEYLAEKGGKVYTGAYMIRAESDPTKEWYSWSKHRYISEIVIGRLWEDRALWAELLEEGTLAGLKPTTGVGTLESVWAFFQNPRYIGWGPFMAYEVVTDLRHTRYLSDAPDIYLWANAGPGAIRGLNRLHGRDLAAKPRPEQTNAEMVQLMRDLNRCDEPRFSSVFGPVPELVRGSEIQLNRPNRFEMRDVEHTLCEFDKYERVRLGEGKMRSKYNWRNATTL